MELKVNFTPTDIEAVRHVVVEYGGRVFVRKRIERNVEGSPPLPTQEKVWLTMAMCLLTTQQRSDPKSAISRFLFQKPFPLSLSACQSEPDLEGFVQVKIKEFGGIRFGPRIAAMMKRNLNTLNSGGWDQLGKHLLGLAEQRKQRPEPDHYRLERQAAHALIGTYGGFGPKQSRNFWQELGLTRYEFVLDSRVNKWLRQMQFPIPLTPMSLGEEDFYCFLSDILRDLCVKAGVLPCVLDAAIFASYDTSEWPEDAAVW